MATKTSFYIPQLEGESDLEFAWFKLYCFLGYDRSLVKVVDRLLTVDKNADRKKLYKRVQYLSETRQWSKRSQIFDLESVVGLVDKAISEQQKVESEWVDRYGETMALYRDILEQNVKASQCNKIILDAVYERLEKDTSQSTITRLQKVVGDAVSSNLNIVKSTQFCLQTKEDIESVKVGRQILETALGDKTSDLRYPQNKP